METEVAKELAAKTGVKTDDFLRMADKVIGLANHSATEMPKQAVHLAFLYAVSRYGVFVWQSGDGDKDAESFISDTVKQIEAMLKEQLGDPQLKNQPATP